MSQYITELQVSLTEAEESELRGKGFKKIFGNLNQGAGGKKIYLWYKKGQNERITRIQFTFTDKMSRGLIEEGYHKIEQDLNAETYGNDIYLWFYRGSSKHDVPIVDLHITTDAAGEAQKFKEGWERLACDLNRKAGGNWIYLWVNREREERKPTYICDVTATDHFEADSDKFQNGFIRVDEDTNRDAGGKHVFIWYRQTTDPNNAIRDLQISTNEQEYQNYQNQDYQPVNVNLNEGTRGNNIYLWYKKDIPNNAIRAMSVITNVAAVEQFEKAGVHVIKKNLNMGNGGAVEYLCFI